MRGAEAAKETRRFRQRSGEIKLICLINNQIVVKHKKYLVATTNESFIVENKRDMNIVVILSESTKSVSLLPQCIFHAGLTTWVIFSEISACFLVSSRDSRWFPFDFTILTYCHQFPTSWRFNHNMTFLKLPPSLDSSFLYFPFIRHSLSLSFCLHFTYFLHSFVFLLLHHACIFNLLEFNIFLLTTFMIALCENKYLLMA